MNLTTIKKDFPYHQNDNDDFYIIEMSKSHRYCDVRKFDFSNTNVSYDAIVAMWRSNTIGYHMGDIEHLYERYYNKLVSIVYVEIQNSKAYEQYQTFKRKGIKNGAIVKLFPLPYRNNFMIKSDHDGMVSGFKEIILTVGGKEINDDTPLTITKRAN